MENNNRSDGVITDEEFNRTMVKENIGILVRFSISLLLRVCVVAFLFLEFGWKMAAVFTVTFIAVSLSSDAASRTVRSQMVSLIDSKF